MSREEIIGDATLMLWPNGEPKRAPKSAGQARGYYAPPGAGPKGETCKTCRHLVRKSLAKTYLKCGKARAKWTGGHGSDVLARSPACAGWEPML